MGAPGLSGLPPSLQLADAARFASSSVAAPIVHFDPNANQSDDEDDDEDGSGRPKKKLRKAIPTGLVNGGGPAAGVLDGGSGPGGEDDKDKGRRKIEIEYIHKKEKRHITFSKRKAGIMKKAYELATLTGTQVLLLVVSETGIVYTFTTAKFQPLVGTGPGGNPSEGQRLIQACLAVDPNEGTEYISPPPDGPLLPLPPSALVRPFEANSAIHGGQIALRTRAHRPGANQRPKQRPPSIRTHSNSGANALPTPIDHQAMLLSPSARQHQHPADYSQGPSVLQGSPRSESLQSSQDYQDMMSRSGGYPSSPHQMPMSAGGRMESYGQQSGMDYGQPGPPPHSAHHLHPSPDRFQHSPSNTSHSPLQQQQQHHFQQQQQAAAAAAQSQELDGGVRYRQHSYEDRPAYYDAPSQYQSQQQHQEEYLRDHHRR